MKPQFKTSAAAFGKQVGKETDMPMTATQCEDAFGYDLGVVLGQELRTRITHAHL